MIECKLNNIMIELLNGIKGTTLLSFELDDDEVVNNRAFGVVRINTTGGALNLFNEVHAVDYFGDMEDISYFTCEKYENIIPFKPYTIGTKSKKIMVTEEILGISIVSDKIFVPSCNYEIIFDMALIIKTTNHTYIISRDWHFMETMYLNIDKSFDDIYPIQKNIENWNNDGEWEVKVERIITEI